MWRLGRVKEVIEGSDGQIRGTTLTVVTNGKQSTLRCPVSCLYPLEVDPQSNPQTQTDRVEMPTAGKSQEGEVDKSEDDVRHTRPVRTATVKAQQRMSDWISELTDNV